MVQLFFPEDDEGLGNIDSFSPLDHIVCPQQPFGDVHAEEYFEFAKKDFQEGDKKGLVNALGNAKRCFHYQVDRLLYRYGLREVSKQLDFPHKIALLSELQILSGTLLRKFNRERNVMEHEYISPDKETVEGSIELCELLLLATERYVRNTPGRVRIKYHDDERDLLFFLEPGSDEILCFEVQGTQLKKEKGHKYYIGSLYQFLSDNELEEGISITKSDDGNIKITPSNKNEWLPVLRTFSMSARNTDAFKPAEKDAIVVTHHSTPLSDLKKELKRYKKRKEK